MMETGCLRLRAGVKIVHKYDRHSYHWLDIGPLIRQGDGEVSWIRRVVDYSPGTYSRPISCSLDAQQDVRGSDFWIIGNVKIHRRGQASHSRNSRGGGKRSARGGHDYEETFLS